MSKEPVRVLHVVGRMDRGGIETMLMNLYRNIDRERVQFDFLAHYGREAAYNDEIRAMGGRIYEMPALKDEKRVYYWRLFAYIAALHRFFREHREYRIVHGHMTNTAAIYMPIAKKYGVRTCIAHSHNTKARAGLQGVLTDVLQSAICRYATDWFACSKAAAQWFYPKGAVEDGRVKVFPNAIDTKRFCFDNAIRAGLRQEMELEGRLVIGCVGRFREQKNQIFLIDVMQEILKQNSGAVLMFVGDGPCEEAVRQRAAACGIQKQVMFLGSRGDVPELMQAMDVLAMPSLFEGMPVVGVEAQAAGLPLVVSDNVTGELDVTGNVSYLSLGAGAKAWAGRLLEAAERERRDCCAQIRNAGYDIHASARWLEEFYQERA